jgi:hypothetical protein
MCLDVFHNQSKFKDLPSALKNTAKYIKDQLDLDIHKLPKAARNFPNCEESSTYIFCIS